MKILTKKSNFNSFESELLHCSFFNKPKFVKSTVIFTNKTIQLSTYSNTTDLVFPKKNSQIGNFSYLTLKNKFYNKNIYTNNLSKYLYRKYWYFLKKYAYEKKIFIPQNTRLLKTIKNKQFKKFFNNLTAINGLIELKTKDQIINNFKQFKQLKKFKKWRKVINFFNKKKLIFATKN